MTVRLLNLLPRAVHAWNRSDPKLASWARRRPPQPWTKPVGGPFVHLVHSLLQQQVSIAAGRSIAGELRAACGGRITPGVLRTLSTARLRAAGVSRQKQTYLRDLARRTEEGELDFRAMRRRTDEEVIEALTGVHGIGPWTAKMFLIFHLERPDVVAPEDLGLQIGAVRAFRVPMARARRVLERRSVRWAPYRSLACLTLWACKDGAGAD